MITWLRAAASTGFGSPVRSHEFPDAAAPLRYCALVKLAFIISQGHVATPHRRHDHGDGGMWSGVDRA